MTPESLSYSVDPDEAHPEPSRALQFQNTLLEDGATDPEVSTSEEDSTVQAKDSPEGAESAGAIPTEDGAVQGARNSATSSRALREVCEPTKSAVEADPFGSS